MSDNSVTDDSIHLLTAAYALDALSAEERAGFAAHLDECDDCAAETASLIETAVRLALVVEEAPPAHLRDAVLREIARTPQLPATLDDGRGTVVDLDARRTRRRWIITGISGLAAAAAIAGAIFVFDQDPAEEILAADDARTVAADVEGGGAATLVVSEAENGGVITFADLPDPGEGRAYQMWLITGTDAPVPEETFDPTSEGDAVVLLEGASDADLVAVTIEPEGGSTVPTEPILAVIEVGA